MRKCYFQFVAVAKSTLINKEINVPAIDECDQKRLDCCLTQQVRGANHKNLSRSLTEDAAPKANNKVCTKFRCYGIL